MKLQVSIDSRGGWLPFHFTPVDIQFGAKTAKALATLGIGGKLGSEDTAVKVFGITVPVTVSVAIVPA